MGNKEKIFIIGIGHTVNSQNARSNKLSTFAPNLIPIAKQNNFYNSVEDRIYEYAFCKALADKIKDGVNSRSNVVKCLTANRLSGADINGNGNSMGHEISAINKFIINNPDKDVIGAINLHLNAADSSSASGYLSYYARGHDSLVLAQIMENSFALGNARPSSVYNTSKANVPGMVYVSGGVSGTGRGLFCPSVLNELFFVSTNNDVIKYVNAFNTLVSNAINGIISFASNATNNIEITITDRERVLSTSLVQDKAKPKISDDNVKAVALDTQNKLSKIERHFGEGGDKYSMFVKNNTTVVGISPPTLPSFKVNENGGIFKKPILREGGIVHEQVTYPTYQNIDITSDLPTGNNNVIVNGANNLKAFEHNIDAAASMRLNSGGSMSLTSGQQIDLVSNSTLNLESNGVTFISSPDIILEGNTVISGNTSVDGSILASGSIYAQGGLNAPAFNGPAVIDKTNSQELYGYTAAKDLQFKLTIPPGTKLNIDGASKPVDGIIDVILELVSSGLGTDNKALIKIPAHNHYFKRLSGTLADSVTDIQKSYYM